MKGINWFVICVLIENSKMKCTWTLLWSTCQRLYQRSFVTIARTKFHSHPFCSKSSRTKCSAPSHTWRGSEFATETLSRKIFSAIPTTFLWKFATLDQQRNSLKVQKTRFKSLSSTKIIPPLHFFNFFFLINQIRRTQRLIHLFTILQSTWTHLQRWAVHHLDRHLVNR